MYLKWLVVLTLLLNCVLIQSVPALYSHDATFWSYSKDHLKQLGLYPRIFRYGTGLEDRNSVYDQHQQFRRRLEPEEHGNDSWSSGFRTNKPDEHGVKNRRKSHHGNRNNAAKARYAERELVFRKFKEQRLKRMEQEAAEVLWRW